MKYYKIIFYLIGCTATAVYLYTNPSTHNRYLQVANVGDSNAYLCRNGKALMLTEEHNAAKPYEKERLKRDFGLDVPEGSKRLPKVCRFFFFFFF
jgi:serine/threonine protein phosphatase PrpC